MIRFESNDVSAASTIYVGSGAGNHTTSIFDAIINYAGPGDTVFVYSGTYIENLLIDKSINLMGEDKQTTIIDGSGGNTVMISSCEWVNVTGFSITNGFWGIWINGSSYVNIQENEIDNNAKSGIQSYSSSNNTFINNMVHDNTDSGFFFTNPPYNNNKFNGNIVYNNDDGIHLEDETSVDSKFFWNNSINNNTVYNNTNDGIFIDQGFNNFIIDNLAYCNGLGSINPRGGIRLSRSLNNTLIGNTLHNNDNGIVLAYSTPSLPLMNNTVSENMVYNNDIGIRLMDATDNTFIDNSIFNNNYSIYMYPGLAQTNGNDFINCTLSNASINNIYMESSGGNSFRNCILSNANINVYMEQQSRSNIFINSSLSNASYEDYSLNDDSHAILLNTTFNKTRVYYGDTLSDMIVRWYMHVNVIYSNRSPASYATIWVNDSYNDNVISDSVNSQGWKRWIIITEYLEQDINGDHIGEKIFYYTPHNATATDGFLWGYAYPEPFMDESRTVIIVLGGFSLINLKPGWNLISLPRIQPDTDLRTILQSIEGDYDAVQWYDITDTNDPWKHHHISKPTDLNDLNELNHIMGFWIHITNLKGATLVVFGNVFSFNQNISLSLGWNLVGYPSLTNYNRTVGLNNINFGSDVNAIWTYNTAEHTWEEITEVDYFERGKGYWMHSKVTKIWDVPL